MEESPLALAHAHGTQASQILSSSQPPYSSGTLLAAANSHALAATSFSAAAKLTKDPEALRTLDLLTKEHARWEGQLRRDAEKPAQKGGNSDQESHSGRLDAVVEAEGRGSDHASTISEQQQQDRGGGGGGRVRGGKGLAKDMHTAPLPSLPFANTGSAPYPPRLQKSTSSLATNLASARGIQLPGSSRAPVAPTPTSSSHSPNRRRVAAADRSAGIDVSAKPTTNPLTLLPPDEPKRKDSEEGFSSFYTSLNTFISRVGSPFAASLAFAGLPLLDDGDGDEEKDRESRKNVLPKAWVEKHGRGRGLEKGWPASTATATEVNAGGGGESFYVVPVSGGTLSYAGVLRRDSSPSNPNSPIDDFESLPRNLTLSPPPHPPQRDPGLTGHAKTKEELQLENTGLRQTIDVMSRNMQAWHRKTREGENLLKNSLMAYSKNQDAGMDILTHVQRKSWLHVPYDGNDVDSYNDNDGDNDNDNEFSEGRAVGEAEWEREKAEEADRDRDREEKLAALEREVADIRRENERLGRENERLNRIVKKYESKWEKLKEGARNKRALSGGGAGAAAVVAAGSSAGGLSRVDEAE